MTSHSSITSYSKNKIDYRHTLIFSEDEISKQSAAHSFLEREGHQEASGENIKTTYLRYKENARNFASRVKLTQDDSIADDIILLNQKYQSFLKSIPSQPSSSDQSQSDINVLIINPLSSNQQQSTIIHCKEGNKITHQFSNFNQENLISRITREVIMYLKFLGLILTARFPQVDKASSPWENESSSNDDIKEVDNLTKKIKEYSKKNFTSHSANKGNQQTEPESNTALELYYDLKTCYQKHQHSIKPIESENFEDKQPEIGNEDIKDYVEDLAGQRFVEAINTKEDNSFSEHAGSKFLGCGIRCSYNQEDPKEVTIERYDYQNAIPKTSRVMYLKIKKFGKEKEIADQRNYRTLKYQDDLTLTEENQYCYIKITFNENNLAEVDDRNIYAITSQNPERKKQVELSSLTQEVKNELIQDISQLTLVTKNYYVDNQMQLEKKEKKLKLSEFFTEHTEQRDEDRESIYESDGDSDAETVTSDNQNEQDLSNFDHDSPSSSPTPIEDRRVSKGQQDSENCKT